MITAGKVLDQAKAALDQAAANIKTAEANLALLDAQMKKLTVYAPMDGIVLARNVEVGEFVQPGATTFSVADLDGLTITVYVPEDQYGNISLEQAATVTVDSFAGETFEAVVIHIADQGSRIQSQFAHKCQSIWICFPKLNSADFLGTGQFDFMPVSAYICVRDCP